MPEDIEVITSSEASAMEAERAAEDASHASEAANQSAVAATAAAINQGQIIDIVTQAAREDAQRARDQAEQAASNAESTAELTAVIAETSINEMRSLLDEYRIRIEALEHKSKEPTVSMISNEPSVTPLNPQEVEQSERKEDMDGGEESPRSSRRKHGRRRSGK